MDAALTTRKGWPDMDGIDLAGKTALVTGASRGIGHAAAQCLSELGANVVLTARTQDAVDTAAETIGGGVGFAAHAADEDAARRCVDFTLEHFGSLDILVNNAATNAAYGPLVDQHYDAFRKTIDLNVWAPILWSSLAARTWMSAHGGAIVNTASLGGLTTESNLGIYNASKAALIHFTKQSAVEFGPTVRVNAVAPGVVRTKLSEVLWREQEQTLADSLPLGRIGEPEDIGRAIAFLASDAAAWITGQVLVIDGGAIL
jgi:NAD(P)-dependent dehydrogenase (short-subunit alcohol dehydrogenase family)